MSLSSALNPTFFRRRTVLTLIADQRTDYLTVHGSKAYATPIRTLTVIEVILVFRHSQAHTEDFIRAAWIIIHMVEEKIVNIRLKGRRRSIGVKDRAPNLDFQPVWAVVYRNGGQASFKKMVE